MKKILLAFVAMGTLTAAQAQFTQRGFLLYGTAGFSNTTQRGATAVPSSIEYFGAPGFGYNVIDNLTVGLNAGYYGSEYSTTLTNNNSQKTTLSQISVGPFIRKTFPLSDLFFAFGQLDASYLFGNTKNEITNTSGGTSNADANINGFRVGVFPAIGMYIKKGWALNFAVGGAAYQVLNPESGASSDGNVAVTLGQQFNLTISKCFKSSVRKTTLREPMEETRTLDTSDEDDKPKKTKVKVKVKADDDDE